jgi:hypothetical protein
VAQALLLHVESAGLESPCGGPCAWKEKIMDTNLLLLIVVLVLLFGGGGFYWRRRG